MANIKLQEKLTAVADAIREKTGKSEKMTLAEMPVEIGSIQSGGGGSTARGYEVDDVTFYDYDGTIVYSCSMADAQNLTELPTPPEHKGLVFQEWNWTLEEIKSSSVGADVGALYDTEDGAIVYDITIESELERTVKIAVGSGGYQGTLAPVIDWGDGDIDVNTAEGNKCEVEHTYAKNGSYRIKISKGSTENRKLKMTPYGSHLFGNDNGCDNILRAVYIGTDCTNIEGATYAYLPRLQYICMHKDILLPASNGLCRESAITIGIIPRTYDGGKTLYLSNPIAVVCTHPKMTKYACFPYCTNLRRLIIPDNVTTIGYITSATMLGDVKLGNGLEEILSSAFNNSRAISTLTFPESLKKIGDSSMRWLSGIKEYRFRSSNPPALESSDSIKINTFSGGTTKIYVPKGTADAYKSATNWAALARYIVEEE